MKKYLYSLAAALGFGALALVPALAAVTVVSGPTSLVLNPTVLPAVSAPAGVFSFTLNQSAGETLSSVAVMVNDNAPSTMPGSHLASVSVYRDNGDGTFDPSTDALAGTQTTVNVGTPTVVTTSSNNTISGATKFFVAVSTAASFTDASPADSFTVTFPANGIVTSSNSPTVTLDMTSIITADTTGPLLQTVVAQNTGGTAAKEAGDSLVFTFSEVINKPAVTASNIMSLFSLNNGHSLLDSASQIGSATWNSAGTALTFVLSGSGSVTVPTVAVGDMTSVVTPSTITDAVGNKATGSVAITGDFGGVVPTTVTSLVTSPTVLSASSAPLGLFSFNLNNANSSLTSVAVTVNDNTPSTMPGSHLASLALYRDNGDGIFNPTTDLLVGSQATVNVGTPTTITATANNALSSTTKFFVAVSTASGWTAVAPADSFTVAFPANAIVTAANSPTVSAVTTATISAATSTTGGPVLTSVLAQNTGGTAAKEAGDSLVFTFSEATNKPAVTASNIMSVFSLNNGHTFLDSSGQIGSAAWNTSGNVLTLVLSGTGSTTVATVQPGDTVTALSPSIITDSLGNQASGSATITGSFGGGVRTQHGVCSNGLINGRLYMVQGNTQVYLAANCALKPFKGKAVGHAKGKKFRNIITLSSLAGLNVITPNHTPKAPKNNSGKGNHGSQNTQGNKGEENEGSTAGQSTQLNTNSSPNQWNGEGKGNGNNGQGRGHGRG